MAVVRTFFLAMFLLTVINQVANGENYLYQNIQATVLVDDPDQAEEALENVKDLQKRKALKILNAAILVKDKEGKTSRAVG